MTGVNKRAFLIVLSLVLAPFYAKAEAQVDSTIHADSSYTGISTTAFHVFDATPHSGKPDLDRYGVISLSVIYQRVLWPNGSRLDRVPEELVLESVLSRVGAVTLCCTDFVHWWV